MNSSITSKHYSKLLSVLEKFEHEIDRLDDDRMLSQSSTRIRDDVKVKLIICQVSNLTEMHRIIDHGSGIKQIRTFIILQQNATSPTETEETIPVFVWMPLN